MTIESEQILTSIKQIEDPIIRAKAANEAYEIVKELAIALVDIRTDAVGGARYGPLKAKVSDIAKALGVAESTLSKRITGHAIGRRVVLPNSKS